MSASILVKNETETGYSYQAHVIVYFFRSESINPGKETHCLKMNTLKLPELKRAKTKNPPSICKRLTPFPLQIGTMKSDDF